MQAELTVTEAVLKHISEELTGDIHFADLGALRHMYAGLKYMHERRKIWYSPAYKSDSNWSSSPEYIALSEELYANYGKYSGDYYYSFHTLESLGFEEHGGSAPGWCTDEGDAAFLLLDQLFSDDPAVTKAFIESIEVEIKNDQF